MEPRGRFQLHLPGLLKVLAEHLYSTRKVGVRELIQNAHDSCVRRRVEYSERGYRSRIDLSIDQDTRSIRIADNGCGLTEQEIHEFLTVIGRGYTRELRERLAIEDVEKSRELIGQFGLGFLSVFLLGSSLLVETRSVGGDAPLRWFSTGDEQFDLGPGERAEPGTTVELKLKAAAHFLLREETLIDVVRAYADFLPTPIHVEGSDLPVNLGMPPWEEDEPEDACRRYIKRRFHETDPLWILPLTDGSEDLGRDSLTIPLRGFLYVPPESTASIKEYGDLAVFIRKMAILDDEKDLLPPWARFVRGVIDCPALQPTASREGIHQDDSFEAVRQTIADQLAEGLRRVATVEPATWRRIAHGHTDVIMGWAAKDREFFLQVADSLPLRTTRGRLTMPEYLKPSGDVVYYVTRELGSLQEKILAEGRDVPVIDASWFAVPAFLQNYAALHPKVSLVPLDDDLETLLRPIADPKFDELVRLCEELGFVVRVSSFKPTELPAVLTYPKNAEFIRDASAALQDNLLPDGFAGLVENFLDRQNADAEQSGTLTLNASCPLIRGLLDENIPPARRHRALAVTAYFAKLFCGRMLEPSQAATDLGIWQRSLHQLAKP